MNIKQLFSLALAAPMLLALLLTGCGGGEKPIPDDLGAQVDSLMNSSQPDHSQLSDEVVDEIMKTIPSPLEFTALIRASGANYSEAYLNSPDMLDDYSTSFQKSVNLGVYGADLGYINLYEKSGSAVSYLTAVRDLADDLKVGQFFDYSTMKRLADNKRNLDSVLYISTTGFERMDTYLKEKQRGNVSVLILYGGWLEAMHIACNVAATTTDPDPRLKERIGEQKIVLDDLLLIMTVYKNQPGYSDVIADLEALKQAYSPVTISYTYEEPEVKEVDGRLVVEDNRSSTVEISNEALNSIRKQIAELRTKVTA